jgi:hypothetical protein
MGEFAGEVSQGWESLPGDFPVSADIEGGTVSSEGGGIHGTSGWGFVCSTSPYAGGQVMGNNGFLSTYAFDEPVSEFGGYWQTNSGSGESATFTFLNSSGEVVDSVVHPMGDCGIWSWAGWSFSEGVSTITIDFAPTHMMSDELTYSFAGGGDETRVGLKTGGECPGAGEIGIRSFVGDDLSGSGPFVVVAGDREGSTVIPGGRCAGTELGVESDGVLAKFGPIADFDGDGMIDLRPTLPPGMCDKRFQVLDMATCDVSEVQTFAGDPEEPAWVHANYDGVIGLFDGSVTYNGSVSCPDTCAAIGFSAVGARFVCNAQDRDTEGCYPAIDGMYGEANCGLLIRDGEVLTENGNSEDCAGGQIGSLECITGACDESVTYHSIECQCG